MSWNRWYTIKSYAMSTIWLAPLAALLLEQATVRIAFAFQIDPGWIPGFAFDAAGINTTMDYAVTLTITCIVFTFSSILVAIQFAGGQLTPRIIATTILRDKTIRRIVALFTYTLLLAVAVKSRAAIAPHFLVSLAAVLGLFCVVAVLFLVDYVARLLRPVSIVWRVGEEGLKVIELVYPLRLEKAEAPVAERTTLEPPERVILHQGTSGIIIAINLDAIVAAAKKADSIIEIVPRIGDFLAAGEPLFLLRGNAGSIDERKLLGQVAFAPERTIEQDSTFAFRVIVDIAIKALSAAINDPTTAVLAIDQLQRLLCNVGNRHLQAEEILDDSGRLRMIFRTPNWDDFVELSLSEIRFYGAANFQVARRLRAMIEFLLHSLPASRHSPLRRELDLLDRMLVAIHASGEDLALARVPDPQGLGGARVV
jgi:uncharacterized membrane protein